MNIYKDILFGVAVGDALGVPAEFSKREERRLDPVSDMRGYGTYNLPPGTWSDDSSLTFCLAEALTQGYDLNIIGKNFVQWYFHNYWTALGNVFDVGITTLVAIRRLRAGEKPEMAGDDDEESNGNGSLMRILPLLLYTFDKPLNVRYQITQQVSSITHGHIRSVVACFYYLEFARHLLTSDKKYEIYSDLQHEIPDFLNSISVPNREISLFDRLLKDNIHNQPEENILSGGYVLQTLEASIWCIMTTDNYKDAVLKAVNLSHDTDTTAAVTGGLAGLLYGYDSIPAEWINVLARKDDIEDLAERLKRRYDSFLKDRSIGRD